MSRKKLFRGKRVDNGEWVEGYLMDENHINVPFNDNDANGRLDDPVEVYPETVCEYTGLEDRNSRYFEGDIFKTEIPDSTKKYVIVWDDDYLAWAVQCIGFQKENRLLHEFMSCDLKIVGNIFDNLGLLGSN